MHNDNQALVKSDSFFSRVIQNDSFQKGAATAVAGLLIAVVMEGVFSRSRDS